MSVNPADTPKHHRATGFEAEVGIAWFNRLTRAERRYWLDVAGSARPVDAFRAYQRRDDERPLAHSGMEGVRHV